MGYYRFRGRERGLMDKRWGRTYGLVFRPTAIMMQISSVNLECETRNLFVIRINIVKRNKIIMTVRERKRLITTTGTKKTF
jgi:hypothetical protein